MQEIKRIFTLKAKEKIRPCHLLEQHIKKFRYFCFFVVVVFFLINLKCRDQPDEAVDFFSVSAMTSADSSGVNQLGPRVSGRGSLARWLFSQRNAPWAPAALVETPRHGARLRCVIHSLTFEKFEEGTATSGGSVFLECAPTTSPCFLPDMAVQANWEQNPFGLYTVRNVRTLECWEK